MPARHPDQAGVERRGTLMESAVLRCTYCGMTRQVFVRSTATPDDWPSHRCVSVRPFDERQADRPVRPLP